MVGSLLAGCCIAASPPPHTQPRNGRSQAGHGGHMAAHPSVPAKFVLEKICWEKKGFFEGKHPSSLGKALSLQNTN